MTKGAFGDCRDNGVTELAVVIASQIRQTHSDGRAYFDRKDADGKTKKEAIRALKRQISNTVYRQLLADAAQ